MAYTNDTSEQAEVTFLFENLPYNAPYRDQFGRSTVKQLPWCITRIGGDQYIQPLPPSALICGGGGHQQHFRDLQFTEGSLSVTRTFGTSFIEFAKFAPFPYEDSRGNQNEPIAGPVAIHFFGGI